MIRLTAVALIGLLAGSFTVAALRYRSTRNAVLASRAAREHNALAVLNAEYADMIRGEK